MTEPTMGADAEAHAAAPGDGRGGAGSPAGAKPAPTNGGAAGHAPHVTADVLNAIRDYAIFCLDRDGVVTTWSTGAHRLTGYAERDIVGQGYSIFGTHGSAGTAGMLREVQRTGSLQQERWWRRRDGRLVWVDELINPLDGHGYVVITRDLTERAEAEERDVASREREAQGLGRESALRKELQAAERRASFLAEASSILVATSLDYDSTLRALARLAVSRLAEWCVVHALDEDGLLAVAEAAHRDPALDRGLMAAATAHPYEEWLQDLQSVMRTGQTQVLESPEQAGWFQGEGEHRAFLADYGSGNLMVAPLLGRGRVLGTLTLVSGAADRVYDNDDLMLAEELGRRAAIALDNARLYREAQEANRAKADFLAVISHELRTPLNAIMGYSDLLDARISGELTDKQRRQIDRIRASARHLLQLIEEILSFARIESGGEEVQPELVDVADIAHEAAGITEPMARSRGLVFHLELPAEPVRIETDVGKARQALVNLLSNAVKFTERGEVALRVRVHERDVVFEVADTGIGIPPQQLDRIFDPFWQVERPNTRRVGGTGLGLSVSRRYVRLLRGELEIDSEPGRGTTVYMKLPLRLTGSGAS